MEKTYYPKGIIQVYQAENPKVLLSHQEYQINLDEYHTAVFHSR